MQVDKSKLFYFHNPPPVATDSIYSTPMVPLLCHTRSDSRESLATYSETIKTNTKQSRKRPSDDVTRQGSFFRNPFLPSQAHFRLQQNTILLAH